LGRVNAVVELMLNISGQIVSLSVKTNVPIKIGDVFSDRSAAPLQYKVAQLQPSLTAARARCQVPRYHMRREPSR